MAIGLGAMMGFKFSKNFDYPYIASSITDFWRRWHISLSTWFREYLYIPLGGNRCKPYRNIINLLIVWCATGFWHGASWNFTLWGLYFALLLILEKYFLKDFLKKASKAIGHIYTLTAVLFGWVLFSFESISEISSFLKAIFRFGFDSLGIYNLISFGGILIACALFSTPLPLKLYNKLNKSKVTRLLSYATCCIMLFICIIFIVDSSYNPFLYFRF